MTILLNSHKDNVNLNDKPSQVSRIRSAKSPNRFFISSIITRTTSCTLTPRSLKARAKLPISLVVS